MIKDYYDILTLKRDASTAEIGEKYKRLVLRWHPRFAKQDHNTAQHNFSQISQAYQVLSDPLKRAFYDQHGYLRLKQGLFSEGELKGGYRFADNPDEIFQKFYHSNNPLAQNVDSDITEKGSLFSHAYGGLHYKEMDILEDLFVPVTCTLNELYLGVAKKVGYGRRVLNLDGRTTSLKKAYKLLQIKPGFGSQTRIQFQGEGHQSINRKTSNLIFQIFELNHSKYIRNGQDLIYQTDISLADALNCKSIEVQTLDNRIIRVPIDEIISPATVKQVIGEGMKSSQQNGNLYIKFNIIFPQQIHEQKRKEIRKILS